MPYIYYMHFITPIFVTVLEILRRRHRQADHQVHVSGDGRGGAQRGLLRRAHQTARHGRLQQAQLSHLEHRRLEPGTLFGFILYV